MAELRQSRRGLSRTDMARLRRMTEAELEKSIREDPDWSRVPKDWHRKAEAVMPVRKSVFRLTEHALLCLTERIHALLDRSAIPVKRDPLWRLVSVRLDEDVIDWFKGRGAGYQTRMNAVLRSFMNEEKMRRAD